MPLMVEHCSWVLCLCLDLVDSIEVSGLFPVLAIELRVKVSKVRPGCMFRGHLLWKVRIRKRIYIIIINIHYFADIRQEGT